MAKKILEITFFLFSIFSITRASEDDNTCQTSYCGTIPLSYPFKQQSSRLKNDCNYISLTCNESLGTPILTLPNYGDFYIRHIDYFSTTIELYDPGDCLMSRLMKNWDLTSSPFHAIAYENYTYYMCPPTADLGKYPIDCLSSFTNSTVATSLIEPKYMLKEGCSFIGSWMIPVCVPHQFEVYETFDGSNNALFLTWNSNSFPACEEADQGDTGGSKESLWKKFAASALYTPFLVGLPIFFVIILLQIIKLTTGRNETNTDPSAADGLPVSTTAPPRPAAEGLDESKINSCTELVVLSETGRSPDSYNTCAICLESYRPQEIVRSLSKCEHCFHAGCIKLWLRKNRTCPVCRTILVTDV